jgi:hypothetical protein
VLSEIRLVQRHVVPQLLEKLPNFGKFLHQHYIESQLLVGQVEDENSVPAATAHVVAALLR